VRVYWGQDTSKRTPMIALDQLVDDKREECRECEARSLVFTAAPLHLPHPARTGGDYC
jgi:hypothetical protein